MADYRIISDGTKTTYRDREDAEAICDACRAEGEIDTTYTVETTKAGRYIIVATDAETGVVLGAL